MRKAEFDELMRRVQDDPSILLLGQNYLVKDGINPLLSGWKNPNLAAKDNDWRSFYNAWESVNQNKVLCEKFHEHLRGFRSRGLPGRQQSALKGMLNLDWNFVYTSAIDPVLYEVCNLTRVPMKEEDLRRKYYANPRERYCAWLYGLLKKDEGDRVPVTEGDVEDREKSVNRKLAWIDTILQGYGVMLIDGWNPNEDWLGSNELGTCLSDLPIGSVWLFGDEKHFRGHKKIERLMEKGIARVAGMSLQEAFEEFDYSLEIDEEEDDPFESGLPITLSSRRTRGTILIPHDVYGGLDTSIKLLTDNFEVPSFVNDLNRIDKFLQFLTQEKMPSWGFFHDKIGFYFKRDCEEKLAQEIRNQLKKDAFDRTPIIVSGPSNSGKTALLANLAMRFKREREFPVFFISGEPGDENFNKSLKQIIREYFMALKGDRTGRNSIIFWDNPSIYNETDRYDKMLKFFQDCNAVLIGTTYFSKKKEVKNKKSDDNYFLLDPNLTSNEENRLKAVLRGISEELWQKYIAVKNYRFKKSPKPYEPTIFYILNKLFEYEYGHEGKALKDLLKKNFGAEIRASEDATENLMDEYAEEFERINKRRDKNGFGAVAQEKLKELKKTLPESEKDKRAMLDNLQNHITRANTLLAVAGQFGLPLPLGLLMRFIRKDGYAGSAGNDEEAGLIREILENDSLIQIERSQAKEYFVRFRHPFDAREYLDHKTEGMRDDDNDKIGFEVNELKKIIEAASFPADNSFSADSQHIIRLIRQFGPNSNGRYGEKNFSPGNYPRYKEKLVSIAECLDEKAENDPEALLVVAHFLREGSKDSEPDKALKQLGKARECLEKGLDIAYEYSEQWKRLKIELCSNLVARQKLMGSETQESIVNQVREGLKEVYAKIRYSECQKRDTNRLLNIWLDCFKNYREQNPGLKEKDQYGKLLLETLEKISEWLAVDEESLSRNFLGAINDIYEELNKGDLAKKLEERLRSKDNESFLYMQARRLWLDPSAQEDDWTKKDLFCVPDFPEKNSQLQLDAAMKHKLAEAADKTIGLLEREENIRLVKNAKKNTRCLKMLLRSKWIKMTGNLPFEKDQLICLDQTQWKELADLARQCNEAGDDYYFPALFIYAVYAWIFIGPKEGREKFQLIKHRFGWGDIRDCIILGADRGKPALFKVRAERKSQNGKEEVTGAVEEYVSSGSGDASFLFQLEGHGRIYINKDVSTYLCGSPQMIPGKFPGKPCALTFNIKGPGLGMPSKGGAA